MSMSTTGPFGTNVKLFPHGETGTFGLLSGHGMADRRGADERPGVVDSQQIGGR